MFDVKIINHNDIKLICSRETLEEKKAVIKKEKNFTLKLKLLFFSSKIGCSIYSRDLIRSSSLILESIA